MKNNTIKGFINNNPNYTQPVNWLKELKYILVGIAIELLVSPLFFIGLLISWFNIKRKKENKKILFGTSSIVTFKTFQSIFKKDFPITNFVFRENKHNVKDSDVTTISDISTNILVKKYPLLIGKYFAFFWALNNFKSFLLYFDGGFLDRTYFLWKLEPIIYQVFKINVALIPYGHDIWDTRLNKNIYSKYGHITHLTKPTLTT